MASTEFIRWITI